jgi:hypothetical protein
MKTKFVLLLTGLLLSAATSFAQSGNAGPLTWTLENGTLTISGTGAMPDYSWDGTPWYSNSASITKVIIENGVTSIGEVAFGGCSSLVAVNIGNGVTSIGRQAFYHCENLTLITIPESVESIGEWAFANCRSLTAVQVEEGNVYFLSEEGDLFDKDKTTLLCCPGGKTGRYTIQEGITGIGNGAFYGCGRLTSVIIPEGVTSIGEFAFSQCGSLTSMVIPQGVTSIGPFAFLVCTALRDVAVFWETPSEVTQTTNIFYGVNTRNIRLHVPLGTEAAYRAAEVWQDFDIEEVQQKPLLENLTADKGYLSPEFHPSLFHYQLTVFKSIESITLQATPVDGATVSVDGPKTLNIGENIFEITVTSQGDVSVYTVVVNRQATEYGLEPLSSDEAETGLTMVTFYNLVVKEEVTRSVIDRIQLKYRLTTGNVSGSLPLHFDVGYSQTFDTSMEVSANSMYEFTLYIDVLYYTNSGSLFITTHYNGLGQPSYVTVDYTRHENTVTAASGNEELSIYSFDMPGDNIRNVTISALTFIGNTIPTPTAIAEPDAQPAIAVYPNPVKESFRINGLAAPTSVIITDLSGRTVLQQTVRSDENIPAGRWPQGVYIVRVNGQSMKIIKK